MNVKPFIPKEVEDMPDYYGCTLIYVNGKKEEINLVSHNLDKELGILNYSTFEDACGWIKADLIAKIEFDSRFSKIRELQAEELKKREK